MAAPYSVSGGPAGLLAEKIRLLKELEVELPRFSADLVDFEDRFLNSRINNKDERPFREREAVVKRVIEEIEMTQRLQTNKVRVVSLWSPRGTGKTSLIRHLAKVSIFSEIRRCGRLLVFDAIKIDEATVLGEDAGALVSSIALWHLCEIFHGHSVELSPRKVVNFKRMQFANVMKILRGPCLPLLLLLLSDLGSRRLSI
ncbi:unnamed protein product [Effrenium voratum]|uniref:Uncharacterized protein n=1 Tax=Effrenium voratum TaxID=2562239 RepID=A0AA36HMZ0_9DINO|nr:unnamed protein product [Effrenium voratum]CAJ1447873.1 unnamed protein product [Effrenium voratum]